MIAHLRSNIVPILLSSFVAFFLGLPILEINIYLPIKAKWASWGYTEEFLPKNKHIQNWTFIRND